MAITFAPAGALGVVLEDRGVGGVLHEEQHVGVGRLQALHLGGQRGAAGLGREIEHDLVARLGRQLAGHLRLSWQKRLSQVKNAMVLRSPGPPLSRHSLRKEKTLGTMVLSLGPVRKNHLIPFSVSVGEAQA